jgi:hypothetical protein
MIHGSFKKFFLDIMQGGGGGFFCPKFPKNVTGEGEGSKM